MSPVRRSSVAVAVAVLVLALSRKSFSLAGATDATLD